MQQLGGAVHVEQGLGLAFGEPRLEFGQPRFEPAYGCGEVDKLGEGGGRCAHARFLANRGSAAEPA
jgi:hypothetical protein